MKSLLVIVTCTVLTNQLTALTSDSSDDSFFPPEKDLSKGEVVLNKRELNFVEGFRQGFLKGQLEKMKGLIKEEKDWEFLKKRIKEFDPEQRVSTIEEIQKSKLPEEVKKLAIHNLDSFFLYKNLTLKTLALLDFKPSIEGNQRDSDK